MKILDKFLGIMDNKETKKDKEEKENSNNVETKETTNDEFISTLQKQVCSNKKSSNVETAIRSGDGMGMNTKIEG